MFRTVDYGVNLVLLAGSLLSGALFAVGRGTDADLAMRSEVGRVACVQRSSAEETCIARNARLNKLFRDYLEQRGGRSLAELVRRFNALVKERELINFDDFLAVMTRPVRYVADRAKGDRVPVYGPLGSDVINPWLAAAALVEGKPLDEQPMYHSAIRALRENTDFAIIGIEDPHLSFDMLPVELRDNARWAYGRLNPTNRFDGGFDHPLFYCVVREAAEKLFRQDHPAAKLNMADLVQPVDQGGFGIDSCLLCHERDHNGVYRRLLGQGLYLQTKAAQLRAGGAQAAAADETPDSVHAQSEMFLLAAERVRKAFPDRIDPAAVRKSLSAQSSDNRERLKPGYDDFVHVLADLGCMKCHTSGSKMEERLNPAAYDAFVLDNSAYNKDVNVRALCELIDFQDLGQSRLLAKAANRIDHEGAAKTKLNEAQVARLQGALSKWLGSFNKEP